MGGEGEGRIKSKGRKVKGGVSGEKEGRIKTRVKGGRIKMKG